MEPVGKTIIYCDSAEKTMQKKAADVITEYRRPGFRESLIRLGHT